MFVFVHCALAHGALVARYLPTAGPLRVHPLLTVGLLFNIKTLGNIERIEETTLLGVILNSDLSWFPHVRHILNQITQRYYLLVQLKNMAIEKSMLNELFQSSIISRIRYAIEAILVTFIKSDIDIIDSVLRMAQRWGISSVAYSYRDIAFEADLHESCFKNGQ